MKNIYIFIHSGFIIRDKGIGAILDFIVAIIRLQKPCQMHIIYALIHVWRGVLSFSGI